MKLRDIIHINHQNKNLKSTFKGMLEFLEDKIQFREFGEFCIKENCVENIVIIRYIPYFILIIIYIIY